MIKKEELKKLAEKLMFKMSEEEYETLENEFETIIKQMEKINQLEGISNVEPMTFPFENSGAFLREDEIGDYLTTDEVLSNTKYHLNDQVKVPKVVE